MNNMMIWCTCAEDNKKVYLQRVSKWYKQNKEFFKDYAVDYYSFVDGEITDEDKIKIDKELLEINFVNILPKLGRQSSFVFPGWRRSFKTALEYGRKYDYIIHIENDVKIEHIEKILEYLMKPGYWLGKIKEYGTPETAFMILNDKDQNEKIIDFYSKDEGLYNKEPTENLFEKNQKFTYIFETNRIGPWFKKNLYYDYICQVENLF